MAMEKIVTTEGICALRGQELIVANQGDDFFHQIITLPPERQTMSRYRSRSTELADFWRGTARKKSGPNRCAPLAAASNFYRRWFSITWKSVSNPQGAMWHEYANAAEIPYEISKTLQFECPG